MIHVILVEPVYEGNVGAVARIMHNFGFSSLRIVGSIPHKNDFYLAMHSEHILEEAEVFPTLADALSGIDRVIAFSRRVGKYKPVDMKPDEMAGYCAKIPSLQIGLVFGRETFGLTDEEADLCPLRCHIPANPAFPSLNLAQAVTVALWEIHRLSFAGAKNAKLRSVSGQDMEKLRAYMLDVMKGTGFFRSHETTNWEMFLSKMLMQLNPSQTMLWRFRQMFNRWHVLVIGKGLGYEKNTNSEDTPPPRKMRSKME
jgi:tRNA/rRNA methyltransferase